MIIAYDDSAKETAIQLQQLGFTVIRSYEAVSFDAYIYQHHTAGCLRNLIDRNENVFLLNISGLTAKDVANILQSSVQASLIDRSSNF